MSQTEATNYKKEASFTRTFNAPREQVWRAWTDPKLLSQWWSPEHFTVPACELDVRPGGALRIDMQGPDGTMYPTVGEYKEVVEPERLSYTNTPLDADGNPLFEVLQTVVLTANGDQTTMELTAQVLSAGPEAAPYLAGMEAGLTQALQKLEGLLQ